MAQVQQQPQQHHPYDNASGSDSTSESSSSEQEPQAKGPLGAAPAYIRRGFVRKVYSILSVQLVVTVLIALPFNTVLTRQWCREHMGLYYAATYGTLVVVLGMSCCCQQAARTFPTNYMCLGVLTVGMSISTGFITAFYNTQSVLMALGLTAFVFLGLTAYACTTKTDFTGAGPYLYAGLLVLCGFGLLATILSMTVGAPSWMHQLYAGAGALLFSMYIVYDTQLIVGGSHAKHQFDVDDYVFAALNLYLDIINLFTDLLSLMGDRS
mmetsp:Transcript_61839/g.192065  ORF Transcript_61839/g.192065 Transcript_61839/m.192065 type:complete len:267 (+) Transcript_61839:95-895(+)